MDFPQSPTPILLEDFGQKVDLTRRIREVLLNYPEGTTVLKELIQNADDAGASTVKLCLDRRNHHQATSSLLSPSLCQFQSFPSLIAFNDAVFTDDDFVSISRIGGSTKHSQSWKTGRFGVGFNSVYHLTELPSFVSSNYVVLFDPQGRFLPNVSSSNPGKRIDFVRTNAMDFYRDQFFPYVAFGCDMRTRFSGTLFRFPLRTPAQAESSMLSKQAYSEEDVVSMFSQLFGEGVFSLLFLKNVVSIEMFVWDNGEVEPRKLYSCRVGSVGDDVVYRRRMLLRLGKEGREMEEEELDGYKVEFVSEEFGEEGMVEEDKRRVDCFYVVQRMASRSSRIGSFSKTVAKDFDMHLLPWGAVAACLSSGSGVVDCEGCSDLTVGRAFCFLPLPVRTGLSVQVNGYFEVASNRRGIWYGGDMDRSGKMRSVWNRLLLEDVVGPCFRQLLLGLRELLGPTEKYYSLWPVGSFEDPWKILVARVFREICDVPVLYSDVEGGKWVAPVEAFLHDGGFGKSAELAEALLKLRMPIVHLPSRLFDMVLRYASSFQQKVVTPDTVRHFLMDCRDLMSLSITHKVVVLEYCLEDLIDDDVGVKMNGLPLLPLANGSFGLFSAVAKGNSTYFVCSASEYTLLERISDRMVDHDIPRDILNRLSAIAKSLTSNLTEFSIQHFLTLFPRFVPTEWRHNNRVLWDPDAHPDHPNPAWFELFWQYLRNNCEKLSLFSDWPILPSTTGHLYRPSVQSKLLNSGGLSVSVRDVLIKIGCKILDSSYGVSHRDLSLYVYDADCLGVLESVLDAIASSGHSIQTVFSSLIAQEKDELRKFLLDPKWYIGGSTDGSFIRNCKRFPMFRVHDRGSVQGIHFAQLENPLKFLPPLNVPEHFLDSTFIMSSSSTEEDILLRYCGLERMGKAQFYGQQVFPNVKELQPEVRDSIMLSVLHNLPQLCVEDASFREIVRSLEFVPTSTGAIKSPSRLYDPRCEELGVLLEDSDNFPCGIFQEPETLDMLCGLGLRTSVSPETIIDSAWQVEQLMHKDQQRAHYRGKILLSYLEVNALKWMSNQLKDDQGTMNRMFSRAATAFRPRNLKSDLERFWNDLRLICWCPVMVSPPFQGLPWPLVSSTVAPPKLTRLQADMWLVSASMRILDGECSSTALSYNLGWLSPPGGSAIAAQLLELGKNNEVVNDQVLRRELALAMPRIYSIMMSLIGSDEMDIMKAVLEGSRWIWVGDGFATSDEVVLDGPLHLAPYIRVIPTDLAVFKELFLELGIPEYSKPIDYANILCRMAASKGSCPLDSKELRAAILIVQHLAEAHIHTKEMKIFLPDLSGRLLPAADLVYNDAPWLLGPDEPDISLGGASSLALASKRTVHKYVHGNISNEVAERLGVCSLRRILLAESADSMNLSLSGAAEAFGQHEALTTRLKHILEMYADGPGLLFELIQNAEDAGASEVIFLLDKSQYGTSSLLSPEMAEWQGPALYCFNDSVFSAQDLYAISRIGQESKLEKPFAIGKFGLGFNCVYHFTDIPTFVSGDNIVMFDPHACYLPGISPSHPGLRIKFEGRKILEQFPDQFSPFLHFGCDLQHSFPGTLFRFPLRSSTVAHHSQIKKEAYDPADVISLFESFSGVISDALVFLRNVEKITIFVKEGNACEMQLLHRVRRTCIADSEMGSSGLNDVFNLSKQSQNGGLDKDQLLKRLSKSVDKELPYKCHKIVVTQINPSGAVSHCWITGECIGRGQANGSSAGTESHRSIPWACVAAYIQSVTTTVESSDVLGWDGACSSDIFQVSGATNLHRKTFEGRAFCFLPLPISTGLPVHINSYFELSSNRRDLWFGNDMAGGGKKRSEWNIYILEDVVAPAYVHLLEKIAKEIGPCDLFFSYWPIAKGYEPWASMVQKIYAFVAHSGLHVLYTRARDGHWISAKQAIFPDFKFGKACELVEALSDAGLPLVSVSEPIVERLREACPSLNFMTPHLLRTLLVRRRREFKDRFSMVVTLEYCLLDVEPHLQPESFFGLPLLPLADGSFATFEKHGSSKRIFVTRGDEYGLLKDSVAHQLVDCDIPEVVYSKLCDIAESEKSNICFLSCNLLEKLFLKLLPVEWQHSKKVTWLPGCHGHPTFEWIRLLWGYLKSNCDDLSIFAKWPILPVAENYLLQLAANSNVIKDDGWSENMSSLLLKVGCLFLRRDLPLDHPQLVNFVQPPTAVGLLNAFLVIAVKPENIMTLFREASEGELHELRSFVLQSKWFFEEQMDEIHINLLKHLPIFESYQNRKLVSLSAGSKWLKPNDIREDLLGDEFVRVESERERLILRRFLEVREPSKAEFFKTYVLSSMPKFITQRGAISAILHDVKLLIDDDASLKASFSSVPFVMAADGSWQQPSRLYDPQSSELQKLLHRKVFFPSDEFSDPESLETLVSLGLKRTLGFSGIIDCARSVSMLNDSRALEVVSFGKKLVACLNAVALELSAGEREGNYTEFPSSLLCHNNGSASGEEVHSELEESKDVQIQDDLDMNFLLHDLIDNKPEEVFWSELKAIAWCPICTDPPMEGLPWLKSDHLVVSPDIVRPKSQMWMVSCKMHILDGECNSIYLQQKLGWMDCINIDILSMQLVQLSKSYDQIKLQSTLKSEFDAKLRKGIPILYSKLQDYIGTDDFMALKAAIDGVSWVWIGDDFVSADALAFDSPVKFTPYLYVVPSELEDFKDLLLALGVRLSFDIWDYLRVLGHLHGDVKGYPLSNDQLNFVHCVLEAIADSLADKPLFEASHTALLLPDSSGFLMYAGDVVYNDAPWIDNESLAGKRFVHSSISNDLANRLGVKSLSCLSLVDEDMTKDLPCMDFDKIRELQALYGNKDYLLFDLLDLADCCRAKKLHLIYDKREHPRRSLLQHNLAEFQGPALVAVLEGVCLTREEVSSLQLRPPWRLRGDTLNYGLGLLSCFSICNLLSVVSGGYFYIFDPQGVAFGVLSSHSPTAKMFSLIGTNLTERFHDQFSPLYIGHNMPWSSSDSTVIRMPLSSECLKDGLEWGSSKVKQTFDTFVEHASRTLVFLKSVLQVTLFTWDEGSVQPYQNFSAFVEPSSAITRNPFSEKKWRKFQISRLFSSSNAAVKLHVIDVNLHQGDARILDQWLVALSLGSGQTRNMALDRRYLAHNLTPVAGVAAHISRDGRPVDVFTKGTIMSPLPLSGCIVLPVTIFGCFLVCHNGGRSLFKYQDGGDLATLDAGHQLIETWNRELMCCVRDAYVEMVVEMQKLKKEPSSSSIELNVGRAIALSLSAYGDHIYHFWPRSNGLGLSSQSENANDLGFTEALKADWNCIVEHVIKQFYVRVADLPLWQLYSGSLVKCEDGMFLSQPGNRVGTNLLPSTVCSFVKEHYPVFSVPWELVTEIQAVGVRVQEIKPKMVRDLLRVLSTSIVLRSVDNYIDVLEYCLSDIELPGSSITQGVDRIVDCDSSNQVKQATNDLGSSSSSSSSMHTAPNFLGLSAHNTASSGDALEVMTSLGKALFDFGRVVVEDIGRAGGPLIRRNNILDTIFLNVDPKILSIAAELKGLPCPTATNHLARLGVTELWLGNEDHQALMIPLAAKFIHQKVLERSVLSNILSTISLRTLLQLKCFSLHLLSSHTKLLFHENWVNHVMGSNMAPWFSWDHSSNSGGEEGPSHQWIRSFWKCFNGSSEELSLFADWPLVPAYLGRPILCRVKERHLIFIPPCPVDLSADSLMDMDGGPSIVAGTAVDNFLEAELTEAHVLAFEVTKSRYPWLLPLLNKWNIPVFDAAFIDCAGPSSCLPMPGQSLGQVIASKLVIAKHAGYFPELTSFLDSERQELFTLFAHDFVSNGSSYGAEEIEALRSLPIYKTSVGSYTRLQGQDQCTISSSSFLKPSDERCLSYSADLTESSFLRALDVPELHDQQILIKFGLPGFETKLQAEQEDILIYLFANWQDLQADSSLLDILKETRFVRNADEFSTDLSRPKDLFDPCDTLLASVFSGERKRFPGERFGTDGWLRILRKSGLRNSAEADVILECAKKVEERGIECMKFTGELDVSDRDTASCRGEVPMELWALAGSVVEAIFLNFAILYGNNFCGIFGKIACIPGELGFPSLGAKRVLTSYDEAILFKDWPLAWSISPIISRQSIIPPEYSWGALHLRSPPAFSTVLKHLQVVGRNGGEDMLAHWPAVPGMMNVTEASCEVLKYLDKIWGSLSSSDINELRRVAFLPAANGTRLVMPNSLFVHLAINLSPFAFELPGVYLPFVKILKDLGLRDTFSVPAAMDLLSILQKSCGYQRLNPNELRAAIEILYFLCDTVDTTMAGKVNWRLDAIVPDDGCRLVHAQSCVYIDSYGSRYVKYIDTSRLRFVHPDLPSRICTILGIKKLSDVVIEELEDSDLPSLPSIRSVPLSLIREKLLSKSFQGAVWSVANSVASYASNFENLHLENMQKLLEQVAERIQFVKFIHTRFLLLPKAIDITRVAQDSTFPEWENGSKHCSLYFIDRLKASIFVAEPPGFLSVLDIIAIVVSQVLGFPIILPIGSLFMCPEGFETTIVEMLKLGCDNQHKESTSNKLAGKELLPPDALQVQLHPLRPFYRGEIVAWRSQNGEKLRYGRVPEDVRPSAGQAIYQFKVETAPGVVVSLLSSNVFSFKSTSMRAETSLENLPEDSDTSVAKRIPEIPESSTSGRRRNPSQGVSELQFGRVSAADLVQAVHEMLSAAGINLDVEKQSLLQNTITLQEQLKESQTALLLEQEKADLAAKEADAAKAAWICRVCLSNEVDVTIVPCGHVLCRRCSSAVSRCPFCRLQVTKTIRIFRP